MLPWASRRAAVPLVPSPALSGAPASPGTATAPWPWRLAGVLRAHWVVGVLLGAGLVLRVLAVLAYHPALLYIDSLKYLYREWPGADPLGYKVLLRGVLAIGDLGTVAVLQHGLGLAIAVLGYALLVRRGAARWLAALAVAPVLLDGYQLQMEQTIMPDVWFEALIVIGLAVLLWRPSVSVRAALGAGLVLGLSATFRQVGEVLVVPALAYVLVAGGGWRRVTARSAALAAAFAVPILCYCSASLVLTGHFWLAQQQGSLPGRLALAADCATLRLPAAARPLCPTAKQQAKGADWLEHSRYSPLHDVIPPPGTSRAELLSEFDSAVESQQPLRVTSSILRDAVRLFGESRAPVPGITPISRWQFQSHYPTYYPEINVRQDEIVVGLQNATYEKFYFRVLRPAYGGRPQVDRPLAEFLRAYQLDGGYTPGPLLALALLAGLAASLLVAGRRVRQDDAARARTRQLAAACLLFTAAAVVVLLASDIFEFSWRYQLPALVTLPPAGALGISALLARRQARRSAPAQSPPARAAGGPVPLTATAAVTGVRPRATAGVAGPGRRPGSVPLAAAPTPAHRPRHRLRS
jgi:hypothetical protein